MKLIPTGTEVILTVSEVYALPARRHLIASTHDMDASIDGINWVAISPGVLPVDSCYNFVLCDVGPPTVVVKV